METLPFSFITDKIAIPCVKCNEYVEVYNLQQHREMHQVWKILHCTADDVPKTMKQLLKKRRQIINSAMLKLDPGAPLPAKVLQKIDWAFEIVRNTLISAEEPFVNDFSTVNKRSTLAVDESSDGSNHHKERVVYPMVEGMSEQLTNCGQSVGVCQHFNSKWRTANEDRYFYTESSFGNRNHGFFGLFDGHYGTTAAEKCSSKFYGFLKDELMLSNDATNTEDMSENELTQRKDFVKQAIRNSFFKMDSYLLTGESEPSKIRWSGSSATVSYIEGNTLYTANSGSVRALFVKKDGSAVSLIEDHTLKSKRERDRIGKAMGSIHVNSITSSVNGLFSSTRGLGNHGDPALKSIMISNPSIKVSRIDPDDQFLVFFTEGISNVFNDEEVMFLLEDIMPDTSEIENLREHFVSRSQTVDGQRDENISSMSKVFTDVSKENGGQSDRPSHCIIGKKGTDFETITAMPPKDLVVGIKSASISNVDNTFEVCMPKCKGKQLHESNSCFLARALVERLVYSSVLAGTRENTSAMVVLLHGCPINLYLLPSLKRKSLVVRDFQRNENDDEKGREIQNQRGLVEDSLSSP